MSGHVGRPCPRALLVRGHETQDEAAVFNTSVTLWAYMPVVFSLVLIWCLAVCEGPGVGVIALESAGASVRLCVCSLQQFEYVYLACLAGEGTRSVTITAVPGWVSPVLSKHGGPGPPTSGPDVLKFLHVMGCCAFLAGTSTGCYDTPHSTTEPLVANLSVPGALVVWCMSEATVVQYCWGIRKQSAQLNDSAFEALVSYVTCTA